jgi:pyruvate,water dikinase
MEPLVIPFEKLRMTDVEQVGGKNSSLGEMISQLAGTGVRVPGGFATTADAYRDFLAQSGLDDKINAALDALDVEDVNALAVCGAEIRQWIMETPFPMDLTVAIAEQYQPWWPIPPPTCPSPCAPPPPPKTCRMLPLPVSRKPS